MSAPDGLLVLGFGGHARSVADVALASGVRSLLFVDDNARPGEVFLGFPVQRRYEGDLPPGWSCIAASGDNRKRRAQLDAIRASGWTPVSIVAPSATIGAGSVLEHGCFVGHHAHIGPLARVGCGTIVNTAGIVEHDCRIGDCVHVSVNAVVAGACRVGDLVFVGTGATIRDGLSLAGDVIVGAGAVVVSDITVAGTYIGVPAKRFVGDEKG